MGFFQQTRVNSAQVPERFSVENGVHGFDPRRVDLLDGVGEGNGRLQASNPLLVREIDLRYRKNYPWTRFIDYWEKFVSVCPNPWASFIY